jgi:hypothetical protein
MSLQSKTAGSGEVSAESQSIWALILAVLAMGILVVTSQLTIRGDDYTVLVKIPERVVREFPARPDLLELEKAAYLVRLLKQERALAAEAERYSGLGLFHGAGNGAMGQQPEALLQVQ